MDTNCNCCWPLPEEALYARHCKDPRKTDEVSQNSKIGEWLQQRWILRVRPTNDKSVECAPPIRCWAKSLQSPVKRTDRMHSINNRSIPLRVGGHELDETFHSILLLFQLEIHPILLQVMCPFMLHAQVPWCYKRHGYRN